MIELKPLSQINHDAIQVLVRELGIADTLRFIRQYSIGYGNYTEERRESIKDLSLDEIMTEIKANREQRKSTV